MSQNQPWRPAGAAPGAFGPTPGASGRDGMPGGIAGLTRRTMAAGATIAVFVVLLWAIEIIDQVAFGEALDSGGIGPRRSDGLDGILWAPLLHGGYAHLASNTVPLLILGFLIALSGWRSFVSVTAMVWIVGGVGVWLIGGVGTIHLGASILIFGWLVFLLLRGVFSRSFAQLALGAVVLLVYGGLLLGVLPGTEGVSWEGHLCGSLGGALAAWRGGRNRAAVGAGAASAPELTPRPAQGSWR